MEGVAGFHDCAFSCFFEMAPKAAKPRLGDVQEQNEPAVALVVSKKQAAAQVKGGPCPRGIPDALSRTKEGPLKDLCKDSRGA